MVKFVLRRLLMLIPVLLGVSLIVFTLMQITPGDPAQIILGPQATPEDIANLRASMGLDAPLYVQFGNFLKGMLTLDFGRSYKDGFPVIEKIMECFPYTAQLAIAAIIFAVLLGVPVGIVSATRRYSIFDRIATVLALVGFSTPNFWLCIMLILLFPVTLGLLHVSGAGGFSYLILPAIALGTQPMAIITRMTRSSMLEVLGQDYIRTAKAKGLSRSTIIYKHALKNALIPVITVVGLQVGLMFGGAVLTETVFAWPGLGRMMIEAIRAKDTPVVQGGILFTASMCVFLNLIVDILYAFVDPRVKAQYKK